MILLLVMIPFSFLESIFVFIISFGKMGQVYAGLQGTPQHQTDHRALGSSQKSNVLLCPYRKTTNKIEIIASSLVLKNS